MWSERRDEWEAFRQAALAFPHLLIVAAAGEEAPAAERTPRWPAAFGLANVVAVAAGPRDDSRVSAAQAAVALAGCWPQQPDIQRCIARAQAPNR
jgi:hypothetical protein